MKKTVLILAFLLHLTIAFGQCATTTGEECFVNITYFKCNNGYEAPKGFEWMKPSKVYMIFPNVQDNQGNYTNTVIYSPYATITGENLTSINKLNIYTVGNEFIGSNSSKPYDYGVTTFTLCLDCGLGYWATVQLIDDFTPEKDSRVKGGGGYPNQGFGYSCGQPTAEDALKLAWEAARKALGRPAKAFRYDVGTNAIDPKITDRNQNHFWFSGSSLTSMRFINEFGYNYAPTPPDNATDFVSLIKTRAKIKYKSGSSYPETVTDPEEYILYGFYFKESNYHDDPKQTFPIFTNKKTGGTNKQNKNVPKEQKSNPQNQNNSVEKLNEEINNYYKLGAAAYDEHRFKDAETYFQKVLNLYPEDKTSYSNLIAAKLELDRNIIEVANKNTSNPTIYKKQIQKRITLLKEMKLLLEKYIQFDNTNEDFNNYLKDINLFLKENN